VLLFGAVLALRVCFVDVRGMWDDEAVSYVLSLGRGDLLRASEQLAEQPVRLSDDFHRLGSTGELLDALKNDSPYGPLYYLLLHATMRIAGTGSAVVPLLRCWNALFAALTAIAVWACARKGLPPAAAGAAAALYAFSAWDIAVGLQLKSYALATFLAAASSWLLLDFADKRGKGKAVLYGVAVGLGILTHYVFVLVPVLHLLWLAVERRHGRNWFGAGAGALVTAALIVVPWLLYAGAAQWRYEKGANVGDFSGIAHLPVLLWRVVRRNLFPISPSGSLTLDAAVIFVILALAALGIRAGGAGRLGAVLWGGAVTVHAAAYLLLRRNDFLWPRYVVLFLPLFWVAVAAGLQLAVRWIAERSPKLRHAALVLAAGVLGLAGWEAAGVASAKNHEVDLFLDWRSAARDLTEHIRPGDVIVHVPRWSAFLGFACYWNQENIHVGWEPGSPQSIPGILALARGNQSVWVLLSWYEHRSKEQQIVADMRRHGFVVSERVAEEPRCVALKMTPAFQR